MQVIKSENETVSHHYTHHVLLMAAIPVVCAFIGTTQIGWNFGDGNVLQLAVYRFCAGGLVLRRDAGGRRGDGTRHLVDGAKLSATAIACALYGFCRLCRDAAVFKWSGGALSLVWLCALVGAVALFYTGYLLYLGIPTFLNINREEGLSFSSSTLAIGVLVLEVLLAITVILWGYGYRLF